MSANQNFVITLATLVLSFFGSFRYLIFSGKNLNQDDPFNVGLTPFTGNLFIIFLYWIVLYSLQTVYVFQYLYPDTAEARSKISAVVTPHFAAFNVLTFLWSWLFARSHYFLSELVVIVNFLNVLSLIFVHKTYAVKHLSTYFTVHIPTVSLPFSWLLYLLFWNGAALFRASSGFFARILANIFIWNFLAVPLLFLVFYNDYAIGFSSSVLLFGLGLGQLFTKAFALQWIFAFTISGLLFFFSIITALGLNKSKQTDEETAPLITDEH